MNDVREGHLDATSEIPPALSVGTNVGSRSCDGSDAAPNPHRVDWIERGEIRTMKKNTNPIDGYTVLKMNRE